MMCKIDKLTIIIPEDRNLISLLDSVLYKQAIM